MLLEAATFGWLCVETDAAANVGINGKAATFGWLCVETLCPLSNNRLIRAATFGWLCVETDSSMMFLSIFFKQPLSGGCVLKRYFVKI